VRVSSVDVVFEHPDFLVVNKPAGVSVHKDEGDEGFVTQVAKQLSAEQLYLVHRLDKMTSGLLILARNSEANRRLSMMFQERKVSKFYIALSQQKPKKKQGLVKGDMTKGRGGSWKLLKTLSNPAITQFFSYSLADLDGISKDEIKGLRLFLLKPHTGKTHQLRVALKSLGSAILGDVRYALTPQNGEDAPDRGYLHAWRLCFDYQGETFDLEALPSTGKLFTNASFTAFLAQLGHPKDLNWPKL